MTTPRESATDPAVLAAAYELVPEITRLVEKAGRKHARAIEASAVDVSYTYWRPLTPREHREYREHGVLPGGADPATGYREGRTPRSPGEVLETRVGLADQPGGDELPDQVPMTHRVSAETAAAAIATALVSEEIVRMDVARVLTVRASVRAGHRRGSDTRRMIAWLLGMTRQGVERLLALRRDDDRARRDGPTRGELLEQEAS